MPIKLLWWLLLLFVVAACSPQQVNSVVPTQTLVPSTETPTATPTLPTVTPQDLPVPQDFLFTPSPIPLSPIITTSLDFDVSRVEQTRHELASEIGLSTDQLQLVEVKPRLYYAVDCPTARSPVPSSLSYGLEITWIDNTQTHMYLTWGDQQMVWCKIDKIRGKYLNAIDPIAAELSALAIRHVSQDDAVDGGDIVLLDALPVQWQDTSLGCPQDGQTYAAAQIDGYRIVIGVGETSYVFHTDSVQLVPCINASN